MENERNFRKIHVRINSLWIQGFLKKERKIRVLFKSNISYIHVYFINLMYGSNLKVLCFHLLSCIDFVPLLWVNLQILIYFFFYDFLAWIFLMLLTAILTSIFFYFNLHVSITNNLFTAWVSYHLLNSFSLLLFLISLFWISAKPLKALVIDGPSARSDSDNERAPLLHNGIH